MKKSGEVLSFAWDLAFKYTKQYIYWGSTSQSIHSTSQWALNIPDRTYPGIVSVRKPTRIFSMHSSGNTKSTLESSSPIYWTIYYGTSTPEHGYKSPPAKNPVNQSLITYPVLQKYIYFLNREPLFWGTAHPPSSSWSLSSVNFREGQHSIVK